MCPRIARDKGEKMNNSELLNAVQTEIRRHALDVFVQSPPGAYVRGCPACKKQLNTPRDLVEHIAADVLPSLIEKMSGQS
jgi:hypothetical protein